MRIGFVIAMDEEYAPFLSVLGEAVSKDTFCGVSFEVFSRGDREVVLAKSGIGEIVSSAVTALLIDHFHCDFVANFGFVGALGEIPPATLVAVKDVVHYDADLTAFGRPLGAPAGFDDPYFSADTRALALFAEEGLPVCRLASGDKFISDPSLKSDLRSCFAADICDMEGAGIALTCARSGVPFAMLKLVSDGAGNDAASEFTVNIARDFPLAVSTLLSVLDKI